MDAVYSNESEKYSRDYHTSQHIRNRRIRFKCPVCLIKKTSFYCENCVRNGDVTHSQKRHPERFAEKILRVIHMQKVRDGLLDSCGKIVSKCVERDELQLAVKNHQQRVYLIKCCLAERKENAEIKRESLKKLREEIRYLKNKTKRAVSKIQQKNECLTALKKKISCKKMHLDCLVAEVSNVIASKVDFLTDLIFQVEKVERTRHVEVFKEDEDPFTVTELDDASRTAYVQGKWIKVTSEQIYKIVKSELPVFGDCRAYSQWLTSYKSDNGNDIGYNSSFHTISSALRNTAQLLSILSFIFNVRLPHRLCYNEFGCNELSESQLSYKVAKLNANIMYLCLAQRVDPELINPNYTLQNLCYLFQPEYCNYRKIQNLRQEQSMVDILVEQMNADLNISEVDTDSDEEDVICESDISPDWEAVSSVLPDDVDVSEPIPSTSPNLGFTGSIVSSAAASMVSFWRGYTSQK